MMVTPVLLSEVISSISGMVLICSSILRVIRSSISGVSMPGNCATMTASRITIEGSSKRGNLTNMEIPTTTISRIQVIVRREVSSAKAVRFGMVRSQD